MKVAIAADHGGFRLKEEIKNLLKEKGVACVDFGTDSASSVDYPDYAQPVAEKVAGGEFDRGILICGTGIGMSMTANKVPGIRCALVHEPFSARMSREHNDANVLAMGERVVGAGMAREIVQVWLDTPFARGRHERRLDKVREVERKGKEGGL